MLLGLGPLKVADEFGHVPQKPSKFILLMCHMLHMKLSSVVAGGNSNCMVHEQEGEET